MPISIISTNIILIILQTMVTKSTYKAINTLIQSSFVLLLVVICNCYSYGQSNFVWFNPNSNSAISDDMIPTDCQLLSHGIDDELGVMVINFEAKPLLMHTQPQVKKWMKDKYLLECTSNIYKADETTFLLLHLKINSENAKHAYGKLEKGSQLKITFENGEHIYVENIERDRGTAQRSKGITLYLSLIHISEPTRPY